MTRAVWHLAINSLAGRPGRSLLLVIAVAFATVLTVAVASSVGTLQHSVEQVVGRVAGLADLQVHHRHNGRLNSDVLDTVRSWPGVELATGRLEGGVTLKLERNNKARSMMIQGVEPGLDEKVNPRPISAGRSIRDDGEVMIDARVQKKLEAQVGDELTVIHFGPPMKLKVVGVFERPELGIMQRPMAVVTHEVASVITGYRDLLDVIDVQLTEDLDPDTLAERHADDLPPEAMFRTPASVRSGLKRGIEATNLLLLIVTILVSLAAGFIILTSLTTSVTERLRELAILRCVGTSRAQLSVAQVIAGGAVALTGAALGSPIGILAAYWMYRRHEDALPAGFDANLSGVVLAAGGAVVAGLLGAAYPAFIAARAQPLEALTMRARRPLTTHIVGCGVAGLCLIAIGPIVMWLPIDQQFVLWFWVYAGLAMTFVGYFLLSVPVLVLIARGLGPVIARVFKLPVEMLRQSVLSTPYRHGFTGGALMVSMAMLVAIWTVGRSVMGGWFEDLKMPDAFLHGFTVLTDQQWQAVQGVEGVDLACPVVMFPVQAMDMQFGIKKISPPFTFFVSSDTDAFFGMSSLNWVQGDPQTARRKLAEGRAVMVSEEYLLAHGLGVGGTITLNTLRGRVPFEVVGVISSPGLDVGVSFFGIQRNYSDAAVSAVFGTRKDAAEYFGMPNMKMVLLTYKPGVDEKKLLNDLRTAVPGSVVGSSRVIRRVIQRAIDRLMAVASSLAVGSLVIACFGVGNLIIAEVAGRRFEYGVVRAIGGPRSLLARQVLAQTLITALVGCVTGTALGIHLALTDRVFHQRLAGIQYAPHIPWDVVAWGSVAVIAAAALAALPTVCKLVREQPRDLLAAG